MRDVPTMHHPYEPAVHFPGGGHAEVLFEDCRVPDENLIGEPGDAFLLAQRRLNGGRIHHAMRWVGQCRRAFDMLCERAVSRQLKGAPLGRPPADPADDHQVVASRSRPSGC